MDSKQNKIIALNVKRLLKEQDLSKDTLAEELSLSKEILNAKLSNKMMFTTKEIENLTEILSISKEYLYADNEW